MQNLPEQFVIAGAVVVLVVQSLAFLLKRIIPLMKGQKEQTTPQTPTQLRDERNYAGIAALLAELRDILMVHVEREGSSLQLAVKKIEELWKWHNVEDPRSGQKRWYFPYSMEDAIRTTGQMVKEQTEVLRETNNVIQQLVTIQREVNRKETSDD